MDYTATKKYVVAVDQVWPDGLTTTAHFEHDEYPAALSEYYKRSQVVTRRYRNGKIRCGMVAMVNTKSGEPDIWYQWPFNLPMELSREAA